MRTFALALLGLAALTLSACLARTAVDVVTLPVKAVGAGVDAVTTSQSEADEKRGREIRKREERLGALGRDYDKAVDRCARGDAAECERAEAIRAEMDALLPGIPVEPDEN
jgi:hypothetical protein